MTSRERNNRRKEKALYFCTFNITLSCFLNKGPHTLILHHPANYTARGRLIGPLCGLDRQEGRAPAFPSLQVLLCVCIFLLRPPLLWLFCPRVEFQLWPDGLTLSSTWLTPLWHNFDHCVQATSTWGLSPLPPLHLYPPGYSCLLPP